tara:strand:+ start:804 stop:1031 length:228 start_codon:yes stop_codon:yes gene_type:complete
MSKDTTEYITIIFKQRLKRLYIDDLRDVAIKIVDDLVEAKLIKDCVDTDEQDEFKAQDIIQKKLETTLKTMESIK